MKRLLVLVGCVVLLSGLGVWFFLGRAQTVRHVVLISIDTCRADRLSCYGYSRKTTPNIDAVAADGVLFENVVSPVPLTLPAHSSMLAGTIPPYHGVHRNVDYCLGQSNLTLAEILKDNGFATGAIVSALVMDRRFGLDQGFD
jgi:arylsulfatase A-like enzyme